MTAYGDDKGCPSPPVFPWPPTDQIRIRPPPTLNISSPASMNWVPPPKGYQYGNWWVSYTSNQEYTSVFNIQYDSYPLIPPTYPLVETTGVQVNASNPPLVDLTSYNLPNSSITEVITAFGYDFPRSGVPWVFDFHGTGHFNQAQNSWELMAWGYDLNGVEYILVYETPVRADNISAGATAGLDIERRVKGGPDNTTIAALVAGVKALGISQLTEFAEQIQATPTDSRRDGQLPVACDESCIDNIIFA
jgi:hypothetical protein